MSDELSEKKVEKIERKSEEKPGNRLSCMYGTMRLARSRRSRSMM